MKRFIKQKVLFAAAGLAFLGFIAPASATSLTVLDSSFESLAAGAYSYSGHSPFFAAPWRFKCGSAEICGEAGILALGSAPDGAQVGYTSSANVPSGAGSIAQDVAAIIPGATYTFSILVGQSTTAVLNGYRLVLGYNTTPHDASTNVQIANVLFNASGDIPAPGTFILAAITATAPLIATGDITFSFGSGSYAMWDQASLTVTPLPAALPLLASGLSALGLLIWRRKRKAQTELVAA